MWFEFIALQPIRHGKIADMATGGIELRKAMTRGDPKLSTSVAHHSIHEIAWQPGGYCPGFEDPLRQIDAVEAEGCADPQDMSFVFVDTIDGVIAQAGTIGRMDIMGEAARVFIKPVQTAVEGADPQHTGIIGQHRVNTRAGQAVAVSNFRPVVAESAGLCIVAIETVAIGAEPKVAVGIFYDRVDIVAAKRRGIARLIAKPGEFFAGWVERRHPITPGTYPKPSGPVLVNAQHIIAAGRIGVRGRITIGRDLPRSHIHPA